MAIVGETEHFNVQINIQKVSIRDQSLARGIAQGTEVKRERIVSELVALAVSAKTAQGAIAKAIRLLEVEAADLGPGNQGKSSVPATRG